MATSVYEANNPAISNNTASRSNPTYLLTRLRAGEADLKADAVAHNSAQLHKKRGTTQGQAPQTDSCMTKPSGSSGHHGQLWSEGFPLAITHLRLRTLILPSSDAPQRAIDF